MSDALKEIRIEESATAFPSVLTTETAAWVAGSMASLFRALRSGRIDARACERLQEVVVFIARFTPADILLADGRQRAYFTYRQLSEELGLGADSTQAVQRALRTLSLSPKPTDPYSYRLASELISRERGGVPILRPLIKSDRRGQASTWELVGIEPRRAFLSGEASVVESSGPVVERSRSVVESRKPVVEKCQPVVSSSEHDCTTVLRDNPNAQVTASCENNVSARNESNQSVVRTSADVKELSTTTSSISHTLSLRAKGYHEAIAPFQCSPGKREEETVKAYESLIDRGYSPEAIIGGIEKYMAVTLPSEQKRFPLKFFEDADLVRGWCGKPEKQVNAKALLPTTGGWFYPFEGGLDRVRCNRSASREEAAEAVREMVARGDKNL